MSHQSGLELSKPIPIANSVFRSSSMFSIACLIIISSLTAHISLLEFLGLIFICFCVFDLLELSSKSLPS